MGLAIARTGLTAATLVISTLFLWPSISGAVAADDAVTWRLIDDFDGVEPSVTIHLPDHSPALLAHRRSDQRPKNGLRCEQLVIQANRGEEKILASHPLPPSMAIDEFRARLWVLGDHPGIQLMVRVRLPRVPDPQTGEPFSMLVGGDQYTAAGSWQQLVLDDLPHRIARRARLLVVEYGRPLDPAEAYVDMLVLNVYGAAGVNRIWVDDLELTGAVPLIEASKPSMVRQASYEASEAKSPPRVRNQQILVDGVPWLPHVVMHQGEPLNLLKRLGFNGIWLAEPVTAKLNEEAKKHELWLISPPPREFTDDPSHDRVIAWCIGKNLSLDQRAAVQKAAADVRRMDSQSRPVLASVREYQPAWHRTVDVVVDADETPSTDRTMVNRWKLLELVHDGRTQSWLSLRRALHAEVAQGGQIFVVNTNTDVQASLRLRQLAELMNLELSMIEPWFTSRTAIHPSTTFSSGASICLLSNRHTDLALVSMPWEPSLVARELLVPVDRARSAFLMEPGVLSPLKLPTVPGGVALSVPQLASAKILFANEPSVVQAVTRHVRSIAPRFNELLLSEVRAELLSVDRLIAESAEVRRQSEFRTRLYRLHQVLPEDDASVPGAVAFRQLEKVLVELQTLRQQVHEHTEPRATRR